MENYMEIKLPAISRNEAFARNVIAAFCVELNPTVDEIDDIKTVVSEAVTNCIVHAYAGKEGEITLRANIDGQSLHIEVEDSGIGIDDIEKARQPYYTDKPEEERSGMGFTIMESFTDEMEIVKNPAGGVTVKLTKNFCID